MSSTNNHAKPVGKGSHTVRPGECLISIATAYGHFWETIWNLQENNELRHVRDNPMVLLPGDRLTIPKLRWKEEGCLTEARHRFRRKGVPAKVRFRFLYDGEPLAYQPYRITIDAGAPHNGQLNEDGLLEHWAPTNARIAEVWIGIAAEERHYIFQLGQLDPVEDVKGVLGRLSNLGYLALPEANDTEILREAVRQFQADYSLDVKCHDIVDRKMCHNMVDKSSLTIE